MKECVVLVSDKSERYIMTRKAYYAILQEDPALLDNVNVVLVDSIPQEEPPKIDPALYGDIPTEVQQPPRNREERRRLKYGKKRKR